MPRIGNKKQLKKRFATKDTSLIGKIPVFIPELRMTVFVDSEKSIAAVREKYLSQREFMNKSYV